MSKWTATLMVLLMSGVALAGPTVLPRTILEAEAEEPTIRAIQEPTLDIVARTIYDDRTTWRGYKVMGSDATVMPGVGLRYGDIVADFSGYLPTDSGHELSKRLDFLLAYLGTLEGFEYHIGYGYYMYPEGASPTSENPNIQEAFATLAYPIDMLRPRVTMVYAWPDEDESDRSSGALYVGGLDIRIRDNLLGFAEVAYNDGLNPFGPASQAESDWSYGLAGLMLDIDIGQNRILRPGVYHQIVFEESHNEEDDQTWFTVGLFQKF